MSNLLIQLPAEYTSAGGEYSYVLSSDGQHIQRSGQAAASLLPGSGRASQITAVIPAARLSWHAVSLPPGLQLRSRRHQQRVRAVLDGLLEEKLLDDSSQLHLALDADAEAGQTSWVATCDKAWLQAHLQALEAAGHAVSRIAPQLWPASTPQLLLSGDADQAQLTVTGLEQKTSLARIPLQADAALLQALLSQLPPDLPVLAEPQHTRAAEALQRPVSIYTQAQQLLAASQYRGDLAQFDLDLGGSTRLRRRLLDAWQSFAKAPQWRAARWAAGIALLAQLLGLNAWAFKENRAIAQRQQQAKQVLQTTFPPCAGRRRCARADAARAGAAAQQLRRALQQRRGSPAGRQCCHQRRAERQCTAVPGQAVAHLGPEPYARGTDRCAAKPASHRLPAQPRRRRSAAFLQAQVQPAMKQPNAIQTALAPLRQHWNALAQREQNLVLLAGSVVLLALLWWVALAPALNSLRTAPARHAAADRELQAMLQMQAQAELLRQQPQSSSADAKTLLEQSVAAELGANAKLQWLGQRAQITLTQAPAPALARWLSQARDNSHAAVAEMKLNRQTAGNAGDATTRWSGSLLLDLPGSAAQ